MTEENNHGIAHNKDEFQVERIAFFSDAVFAIAITLLVIEIKVPELHVAPVTDSALLQALSESIPKFIGFFVSFFVIALYWVAHHRMFRYVHRYNQKLLWVNIVFLLTIVAMPFSTALYSEFYRPALHIPIVVYALNIGATGLYSYRLWHIIGNPKYNISTGLNKVLLRYNSVRALVIPCVFITVALLSYFSTWFAIIVPPLTPVISLFIRKYYYKKYPDIIREHISM